MLLDIEVPIGIQHPQRHPLGPRAAQWESQQLRDQGTDRDAGLSQTKKLIQPAADLLRIPISDTVPHVLSELDSHDGKQEADHPHPHRVHRQGQIIPRSNDRAHFGEGRVIRTVGQNLFCISVAKEREFIVGLIRRRGLQERSINKFCDCSKRS